MEHQATDNRPGLELTEQQKVDIGVKNTAMAIRETLLSYFKGYCSQRIVGETNVWLENIEPRRGRHVEQHQAQLRCTTKLMLGDYSLGMLTKQPMTITLHLGNLDRSRTMRALRAELERFLERYMRSITVQTNDYGSRNDWRGDRQLVQHTQLTQAGHNEGFPSYQFDYYNFDFVTDRNMPSEDRLSRWLNDSRM